MSLEQVAQKDGLQLGNLLKAFDTLVEHSHDLCHDVFGLGRVGGDQVALLQDQVEHKERIGVLVLVVEAVKPDHSVLELVAVCRLNVLEGLLLEVTVLGGNELLVEGVVHFLGRNDVSLEGAELEDERHELLDGLFAHGQNGVLHHEVHQSQELLQFTELIGLLRCLVDVEPTLANVIERSLDDFGQAAHPSLLTRVVADLGDAGGLDLLEFVDTHSLGVLDVEDTVLLEQDIAFSADLYHGADGFFLDVQGLEAEV
mmetsp:Transcript_20736/g.31905  ORF Transcript_20736/g.31905 Transcript_20736/m.31905 type:complete len:257 (+) Transcript_20736:3322-4092(+)